MSRNAPSAPEDDEDVIIENGHDGESRTPSTEEIQAAAKRYKAVTGDENFPQGPEYPHAGNIAKKLKDHQGKGTTLATTIDAILKKYMLWRKSTFKASGNKETVIAAKVKAFDEYSSFLDTEPVDEFDSRGALVSSALEEFCYYLLEPVLKKFPHALLGKQDTYQGLYFTASNFKQLLKLPTIHTPVITTAGIVTFY